MARLDVTAEWPARLTVVLAGLGLLIGLIGGVQASGDAVYDAAIAVILIPVFVTMVVAVEPSISVTAGLGLSIFSGRWDQLGIPIAADRALLLAGVLGIALRGVNDPRYRPRFRPVHGVLLAAALYVVGSAMFVGTLDQHDALYALLDRFGLISFALFFIAPVAFATDRQRSHLLVGLVLVAAYLGITALFEEINLNQLVVPSYITDPGVGTHFGRARGPFVEAAANGLALFACAVAATMAAARWRRGARDIAIVVGILCLAGIVFTVTRQAWLGAAVGSLLGLGATPRLRAYALPLIAGGVLLVFASFAAIPGLQDQAGNRANDQKPVWDRLNSNRAGVAMVAARPVLGFGWGRFLQESGPYYKQAETYPLTIVPALHSVFLSNAVELGLVGALLWAAALMMAVGGAVFRRAPPELEPWRLGLLAYASCWLVVSNFTPLGYTFSNYLLWTWAGLLGAATIRRSTA
ncbi:MAG: putative inorganic carbon ((-)) transporter [Solirubrobacteraceae bacterium]|jgi:O-antigen ligase|nr:putative inorganic carbon ((-)) transporter [Solirubrobacteraceae bacterium]